jgi:hypothetical protein
MYILEGVESTMIFPSEQSRKKEESLIDNATSPFCPLFAVPRSGVAHKLISFLMSMCHELDAFERHPQSNDGNEPSAPLAPTA